MSLNAESHRTPGPQYLVAGRYRLRSRIGGGGMGMVWLARDQLLDREVAVKQVVSTEGLTEDSADNIRKRAMREGRIAAKLSHRNAISVHDVALDRGEPWLVMEYLPSRSVAQILHAAGTLDTKQAAQIGAQVADAMTDAHDAGIIHRDIKPGNILIASTGRHSGQVKITDFGISKAKDDVTLTQTGVITGTPAYFAPEVARGAEPTEASDVYSLGATVYTMVEGQPPFGVDDNSLVLLHKVARAQITPMTRAGDLQPVLLSLLEPNPARRPTMAEARDKLAAYAAGSRGTTHQILTSAVTRSDGGPPLWAQQRSTRSPRPQSTGTHASADGRAPQTVRPTGPHSAGPGPNGHGTKNETDQRSGQAYAPTLVGNTADTMISTPSPNGPGRFPPNGPTSLPENHGKRPSGPTSTTALALSILAFFVVLAGVVILVIALTR
ncbi:serine/threonine-protein kinase [Gordonia soli]|nr:serine/threonine-protein kinase [Gordonia soli]